MENRWGTERIEAFSDGVFAIAMTLLVLDLPVPEPALEHTWRTLLHQWPAFLAYLTSFATIGAVWLAHHAVFRRLEQLDSGTMRVNLLLLLGVGFLPYPTLLAADSIHNSNAERTAVIFYGLWLLFVTTTLRALWASAAHDPQLLRREVDQREVESMRSTIAPSIGLYLFSTALAIFLPRIAALAYLAIAVFAVLRARAPQQRPDTPGDAAGRALDAAR